jgi:hypothetical protein
MLSTSLLCAANKMSGYSCHCFGSLTWDLTIAEIEEKSILIKQKDLYQARFYTDNFIM